MDDSVSVELLTSVTADDATALARILAQLSATAIFDLTRISEILDHDATELFVARADGQIVGMVTLVTFPLPSGLRGHVEDLVVDEAMRGHGVARQLLRTIIALASERGLRTLDLTSRPSRESALRLYESFGFEPRDTSTLRYLP